MSEIEPIRFEVIEEVKVPSMSIPIKFSLLGLLCAGIGAYVLYKISK